MSRHKTEKLEAVVTTIAELLGEARGDVGTWTKDSAKDAGLDILCYRSFPDQRGGRPVFLVQCASGGDWESKLKTPDLEVWEKLISFVYRPKRAFSTPFALPERDYKMHCNKVNGLLLDRHRLLAPGHASTNWLSGGLARKLNEWTHARIGSLPAADAL